MTPSRRRAAASAFVLAWFVWFAWSGLSARFAPDDMMNLHGYWQQGWWRAVTSQFSFGFNAYRPLGALFYLPLFGLFGLNPLPFRIVIFVVLAANVWLTYRVARRLGCEREAAGLAALVVCYHANLADLHYSSAVVYDILCYFFYFAALLVYVRARRDGRRLGARDWGAFLVLFVCALNAKEMAVTLPPVLLVYEALYQKQREWRAAVAAGAITAINIASKKFGADPLMAMEAYRPVFTLERFLDTSRHHANDLFYTGFYFTTRRLLKFWLAVTVWAWWRPRRELKLAWAMIVLTPLPVVFLVGRTHSCLYIPLAAWAIFAGATVVEIAALLTRGTAWRWAVIALAVAGLAFVTVAQRRHAMALAAGEGKLTQSVIEQFRAANPHVPPRSRVLLVDDPFSDWDAKFIAELWFGDRTVEVRLQNKTPLSPAEIAKETDYVFRFSGGKLLRVKP